MMRGLIQASSDRSAFTGTRATSVAVQGGSMPEVVHCPVDSTFANRSQLTPDALALTDHCRKVTTCILSLTGEQIDELGD